MFFPHFSSRPITIVYLTPIHSSLTRAISLAANTELQVLTSVFSDTSGLLSAVLRFAGVIALVIISLLLFRNRLRHTQMLFSLQRSRMCGENENRKWRRARSTARHLSAEPTARLPGIEWVKHNGEPWLLNSHSLTYSH